MKIGIQTWGSEGDIRPFIALGAGFKAAGHEVTIVVTSVDNKDYSALCQNLGLGYSKVPERINYDLTTLARYAGCDNTRMLSILFNKLLIPFVPRIYSASEQLCKTNDLVIGHCILFPLKAAALIMKRPQVSVTFYPGMIPTRYRPPDRMPHWSGAATRLEWSIGLMFIDLLVKRKVAALWQQQGLPQFKHVLTDTFFSDMLNLVAASPILWSRPADWAAKHHMCGFFDMPADAERLIVPEPLRNFITSGEPPIYMTLGSSQQIDPQRSMDLLVAAAKKAGCRTLIQTASQRYPQGYQEGDIYFVGRLPNSSIFPQCKAVVHHGGAGTTHSVTKAGRPSVVIGFIDEQISWGKQLCSLGTAAPPLRYRKITPRTLANTLQYVINSTQIRRRAEEVGKAMQQENGVAEAIKNMYKRSLLS